MPATAPWLCCFGNAVGAFLQIWGRDANRALRQPEEVVVRIPEETEHSMRNGNSKQKETVECKHSSLGTLKTLGKTQVGVTELHCSSPHSAGTAVSHSGLTASGYLTLEPHGAHAEAMLPLTAPRRWRNPVGTWIGPWLPGVGFQQQCFLGGSSISPAKTLSHGGSDFMEVWASSYPIIPSYLLLQESDLRRVLCTYFCSLPFILSPTNLFISNTSKYLFLGEPKLIQVVPRVGSEKDDRRMGLETGSLTV